MIHQKYLPPFKRHNQPSQDPARRAKKAVTHKLKHNKNNGNGNGLQSLHSDTIVATTSASYSLSKYNNDNDNDKQSIYFPCSCAHS